MYVWHRICVVGDVWFNLPLVLGNVFFKGVCFAGVGSHTSTHTRLLLLLMLVRCRTWGAWSRTRRVLCRPSLRSVPGGQGEGEGRGAARRSNPARNRL